MSQGVYNLNKSKKPIFDKNRIRQSVQNQPNYQSHFDTIEEDRQTITSMEDPQHKIQKMKNHPLNKEKSQSIKVENHKIPQK